MRLDAWRAADRLWAGLRSTGARLRAASYALRPARPIEPRRFGRRQAHNAWFEWKEGFGIIVIRLDGQVRTLEALGRGEGQPA